MGIRLMLSVMIFSVTFCLGYSYPSDRIHYYYREQIEKDVNNIELTLEEMETGSLLTCKKRDEFSVSIEDKSLSTMEWSFTKPVDKSAVKVRRDSDFLIINGIFKGKEIHERVPIDERPWYQATSLSLRDFVFSTDQERIFWTLRSDNLGAIRFSAVREANESIKIGDMYYNAVKIVIRPIGIKSIFWKGVYWFKADEGFLLKFQGAIGLPGSAISEITFIGFNKPSD